VPQCEGNPVDPRVQRIFELIAEKVERPLALEELSHQVNLSVSRLRHLFKAETGITPSQYLKRRRLEKAGELAATTFLSVKEIMVRVGMRDESHFVRDFQRRHGLSPRRYRAASRLNPREKTG
jgi:AraC family transcriptional regulator, arabinose operon regulatory protein